MKNCYYKNARGKVWKDDLLSFKNMETSAARRKTFYSGNNYQSPAAYLQRSLIWRRD